VLTATDGSGEKVHARLADRASGPFTCFCCRSQVTLRRGQAKAAHFAHRPPYNCEYGQGESDEHRRAKEEIFEHLSRLPHVTKLELERDLIEVRPDVSCYIGGVPVAVEVQASSLSVERIARRTAEYARKGVYVLWLPLFTPRLLSELYDPRPWERWLHAAYSGRVYYWAGGFKIRPVHFRDYFVTARGRTQDYGKFSRRVVPIEGREANLSTDFARCLTAERSCGRAGQTLPAMRLYVDTQPRWYWEGGVNWARRLRKRAV
jgi:competence protein CoiA